jgi:ABC-type Fe3+-hydroxamate transport system substrate-binding protein
MLMSVAIGLALTATLDACGLYSSDSTDTDTTATGSSSTGKGEFPRTVTDASGHKFVFDHDPRIGVVSFGGLFALADVGAHVHAALALPADAKKKIMFPSGGPDVFIKDWRNPEEWAKADVDVIVVVGPNSPDLKALEVAAPVFEINDPTYWTGGPQGVDALKANVTMMGELTGHTAQADAAITRYDTLIANLQTAAPADVADRTVAPLYATDDGTYFLFGQDDSFCVALQGAKLGRCLPGLKTAQINAEAFLAQDPDWIIYVNYETGLSWTDRDDVVWKQLTAVKDQHVYDSGAYTFGESLRNLEFVLNEYAFHTFGADVPDPGEYSDFDPTQSPLAMS